MIRLGLLVLSVIMVLGCTEESGTPETAVPVKPVEKTVMEKDNSLMRVISGEVWYRERIALPPGAEVKVVLEDQSRMDAPAEVITDYTHVIDGAAPYEFRLVYSPDAIKEGMRYGLRATIKKDGKLMFTSTEHIDPFSAEPGEKVNIMVSRVGQAKTE